MITAAQFGGADALLLAIILLLLFVLFFLDLAEMGLSRTTRPKAASLVEEGRPGARALLRLVHNPERWVNPVLLSIAICQTAQVTLTTILTDRLFGVLGVVIGNALNIVVFFVLVEALPKTWALLHSERAALVSARPVSLLVRFPPLSILSRLLIFLTNVVLPGKGLKKGPFVSESELLGIVGAAADEDVIEHEERQLIESIIEFGDTVAREIMVPRPDMFTVPAVCTITDALDKTIAHGYSRVPVVGENMDDVVGIVYTKDLMRVEREGGGFQPVSGVMREARFVPETKPVARLMREMQAEKIHMAILVDEYGGIAGLVTLEDCIEELIGDIVDEYDVEAADVQELGDGELLIDGGFDIDEVNELLGVNVPTEDFDTIGGFVFGRLGHVATEGESIEFEGHTFTAEKVDGRRISLVRVTPVPGWEPPETDERQ
ncbi:MAG: magnesium and cobalt exporter, family [Acidimicrobiaceae bacterium]|nr:magnesium and cobalt exporter, family [Acidimicrobiaceae bacterium]